MMDQVMDGLNIVLETPELGSLKPGSPVYYRQVQVGRVMGSALSPTAQEVYVFVNIEEPYDALIRENTVFWNASGISVKAGIFSGVKIYTESMETILAGGIAFATPEGEAMGAPTSSGQHFILQDKMDEDWLAWKPEIKLSRQ
jgi:paraquat-inducible protein B